MDMDSLSKTPVEPIVSLFSITYEKLRCKRIVPRRLGTHAPFSSSAFSPNCRYRTCWVVSVERSAYLWRNGSITPLASLGCGCCRIVIGRAGHRGARYELAVPACSRDSPDCLRPEASP